MSRAATTLLVVVAMLLAACGGDGDQTAEPAEETDESIDEPDETEEAVTDADGDGEVYEVRFTTIFGPGTALQDSIDWWLEELHERSGGRIQAEVFYGASLLGGADTVHGLADGRAEGGYLVPGYTPSEFPLWGGLGMIPGIWENPEARARALHHLSRNNPAFQEELEGQGVKVISFVIIGPPTIGTREPVTSLDELDGLQVRTVGQIAQAWQAVGMDPVAIEAQEVYESLQRGVIDAWSSLSIDGAVQQGWHEVAPHVIDTPFNVWGTAGMALGLPFWESLPADLQELIEEMSTEFYDQNAADLIAVEETACDALLEEGGGVVSLPEDEYEWWANEMDGVFIDAWRDDAMSLGASEEAVDSVLADFEAAYDEALSEVTYAEDGLRRCAARS